MNYISDGRYLVGCYDQEKGSFLNESLCQQKFTKSSVVEFISENLGHNILKRLQNEPVISGPPCEGTILLDETQKTSLKEKSLKITVLPLPNRAYEKILFETILKERPFTKTLKMNILNLAKADINNDGKDEIIFAIATSKKPPTATDKRPFYSLFGLRYIDKNGTVRTKILLESDLKDRSLDTVYNLAGVSDINEDKVMELMIRSNHYEGEEFLFLPVDKNEPGNTRSVSSNGCGA